MGGLNKWTRAGMADMPLLMMKLATPASLTPTLMELLATRLGCQKTAAKSLVISRWEKEQTNRYANFTLT